MGYYTTPAQLAMRQRSRFQSVIGDQRKVHKIVAESGYRDFLALTSGRISSKQLAAMGHPFGRGGAVRGGQRGVDPKKWKGTGKKGQVTRNGVVRRLPINRQTGRLRQGIQLAHKGGAVDVYELFSTVPYARHVLAVEGTDRMVPRGLLGPPGELRKRHKARIQEVIDIVRKTQQAP